MQYLHVEFEIDLQLRTYKLFTQTLVSEKSYRSELSIGAIRNQITFHYSNGKIFHSKSAVPEKIEIDVELCRKAGHQPTKICPESARCGLSIGELKSGSTFHCINGKFFLLSKTDFFCLTNGKNAKGVFRGDHWHSRQDFHKDYVKTFLLTHTCWGFTRTNRDRKIW